MLKAIATIVILYSLSIQAFCQVGGRHSFEFLNLAQSSRTTSLGGALISVIDQDVTLAYANPALLNDSMHTEISFNHNFYFADISHGFANTAYHHEGLKTTFHLGFNYINYGDFVRADIFGNQQGNFTAGETAITFGAGKLINERIRAGVNFKLVNSKFDSFRSSGIGVDLGLTYSNPDKLFDVGIVVKNIGYQLSAFNEENSSFPLDVQIGMSKRFAYLPFRLSITAHQLHRWNIRLDGINDSDPINFLGQEVEQQSQISKSIDNFFRHFIFSGEFLIGKNENLRIRIGYNQLRKQELKVSEFKSLNGLSFGIGFKVSKFRFDYGVGYYHLVGATNHLGLSMKLSSFGRKL